MDNALANTPEKSLDELEYFVLPVKDYSLDIDSISYEDETGRQRQKGAPSVKAKVAVKKKPVIKWKPYKRPERLDEIPYLNSGDSTPPPGMFEEECAFMWRTIDNDDADSLRTAISGVSSDPFNDVITPDAQILSHYNEVKIKDEKIGYIDEQPIEFVRLRHRSKRTRRSWYRPSFTSNRLASSWPYIYKPKWSHRKISPRILRSISEASFFLDTLASKLRLMQQYQKRQNSSIRKSSTNSKREYNLRSSAPSLSNSNVS